MNILQFIRKLIRRRAHAQPVIDPALARRNELRQEQARIALGDKWLCASSITRKDQEDERASA